MSSEYQSARGKVLDQIAFSELGAESAVAALLDANPHLERFGRLDKLQESTVLLPSAPPPAPVPRFDPW